MTTVFVLPGFIYPVVSPPSFKGELIFTQADTGVEAKFFPINQILNQSNITAETLLRDFVTQFNDYEEVRATIRMHSAQFLNFEGTDEERDKLEIALALKFSLIPPSKKQDHYMISFEAANEAEGIVILDRVMREVSLSVAKQNLQVLKDKRNAIALSEKNQLDRLYNRIEAKKKAYSYYIKKRILFLEEQAELAAQLDIENGLPSKPAANIMVGMDESPFYFRGYKVIEKEIHLLETRRKENAIFHIPGYEELLEQVKSIKASTQIEDIDTAISLAPLDDTLRPVSYRIDLMANKSGNSFRLMLILAFVGLMLSAAFVVVRKSYRNHQSKQ